MAANAFSVFLRDIKDKLAGTSSPAPARPSAYVVSARRAAGERFACELPVGLEGRYPPHTYARLAGRLSDLALAESDAQRRARGAAIGGAIGAGVAVPLGIFIGVATIGLGTPLSAIIDRAGASIGTAAGAAVPLLDVKTRGEVEAAVREANEEAARETEGRGAQMRNPFESNSCRAPADILVLEFECEGMPSLEFS
eukprot:m51a1_g9230 hypothetical protein (197) ;mRNA; f:78724-79517